MTRVDFYVLESGTRETLFQFVCRLTEKAWRKGNRIFMHCHDDQTAAKLDDLLWTYRDISFLPHSLASHNEETPIVIGVATGPPDALPQAHGISPEALPETGSAQPKAYDLLINLADSVPEFFSRFERVIETTGIDDQHRQLARERYRYYQQRGYALETHKISGA